MRQNDRTTRRAVIAGVGTGGLLTVLAACGASGDTTATEQGADASAAPSSGGAPSAGGALTSTADIPVGGGKVFPDRKVVVVQPEEGTFKGYTAVCTHQGCTVQDVRDGSIVCPCHMSTFSVTDGSVQKGPATQPLAEVPITVSGDRITLA
ncbi:iron-sulfur protein [Microtetraspora sp. NBRC 13810]|uniref:Rieske (2Fe-2S) protein n=1 Tax=Microtetraspora sp. NBRC 13810 TaxID=3030990 RepID=UPI0024A48667|nr:Rieske (2Fe-2S) protein [Microtetraspora sp. NBRC 13810]GLW08363.1 iron-sulfur protein [Microtetraspora sp. NBRC 13810]